MSLEKSYLSHLSLGNLVSQIFTEIKLYHNVEKKNGIVTKLLQVHKTVTLYEKERSRACQTIYYYALCYKVNSFVDL